MPHVIVTLWPGKGEQQKQHLADAITRDVATILGYGNEAILVGFVEVTATDWCDQVFQPEIVEKANTLHKEPDYTM